jgi:hypothetical protein
MPRTSKEKSSELHSSQLLVAARRVAAEMERLKTGPIWISNQPSFDCALGDLSRWGKACEDAFTAKLKATGHFRAETEALPPHPARKAGKTKKLRKTSL